MPTRPLHLTAYGLHRTVADITNRMNLVLGETTGNDTSEESISWESINLADPQSWDPLGERETTGNIILEVPMGVTLMSLFIYESSSVPETIVSDSGIGESYPYGGKYIITNIKVTVVDGNA